MVKALSTHVFLRQRLHPGLLDLIARTGADGVEVFAARHHFNYADSSAVRELADWFRSNPLQPFSVHAPLFPGIENGRDGAPRVNIIHSEKSRRIDSMDEIKRALEAAEQIPFRFLVLHLGERDDAWNARSLEHSLTALEHLQAFARPIGVQLLVENLTNEVTEPAHLLEILNTGHFSNIGVCLDVGHAHLGQGVPSVFAELEDRVFSAHLHDNKGDKDSHLWPGDGTIDWETTIRDLAGAKHSPAGVLEIHYNLDEPAETVAAKAREFFQRLE